MNQQKIYFPNLNGLRFIAAFLVIIYHVEQMKSIFGIDSYWEKIPFIMVIGKLGVVLFFVLSGFLITYLLLAEEHFFKKINIKKFYIRRLLRVWPLYFLIIISAFLIFPNISLFTLSGYGKDVIYSNLIFKLFLYVIFFPNLALSLFGFIPFAAHTWSIGSEEQYYIVWPIMLRYFRKYRLYFMFGIIFLYLLFAEFLNHSYSDFLPHKKVISGFWSNFNIDCMAIGGIYAIMLFQKYRLVNILVNKLLFYCTIMVVTILIIKGTYIRHIHCEFYSVLFGIIILNFASNAKVGISLENKILNYLGSISYGLYMYHPICIVIAISIGLSINSISNWLLYPLSFILTLLLSGFSYQYFEKHFLKFKPKFSKIISGNEIKT